MMKIEAYKTYDGSIFSTLEEAAAHEEDLREKAKSSKNEGARAFEKYKKTYYGAKLLKEHKITEDGVWVVYGEDPNCDMGGHHHMPYIGTYEGKLYAVILKAITHPKFWQWGAGGEIRKIEISKV